MAIVNKNVHVCTLKLWNMQVAEGLISEYGGVHLFNLNQLVDGEIAFQLPHCYCCGKKLEKN